MLVNVALPLKINKFFTYQVPDFLESEIKQGHLVLVPFGKKKIVGIAIDFPKTTDIPKNKIKSLYEILQKDKLINFDLILLAKWISYYYCSTIGEAISLIIPQGLNKVSKNKIKLNPEYNPELEKELSKNEKAVFEIIKETKTVSISQIQKRIAFKSVNKIIKKLIDLDLIRSFENIKTDLNKFEDWIEKINIIKDFSPKSSSQKKIINYILENNISSISVKNILQNTSTSKSSLKSLAEKNIFQIIKKPIITTNNFGFTVEKKDIKLNEEQIFASNEIINSIKHNKHETFLLHGITGSGKTEVYIEAIKSVLQNGGSVIFLVPEISLATQTVGRLKNYFLDEITILHSNLSDTERFNTWKGIKENKFKIIVGARSAVFAPVENLSLIIVDEEHESSFKQYDSNPRYNARDVAIMRGRKSNAVVVIGSATPSIESYYNSKIGKYKLLELTKRIDKSKLPEVKLVDLKIEQKKIYENAKLKAKIAGKNIFNETIFSISNALKIEIENRLKQNEGIIILQNRRGYAPFLICTDCGIIEKCDRCDLTLTYHLTKKHLRCHTCGIVKTPPNICANCKSHNLKLSGFGTQRIEEQLKILFPNAKILRYDLDTTSGKGNHEELLQKFANREYDILLGTQMIAKGIDFHHVNFVGVINADTQMLLPDFRASEKTFQLITQVSGRAGRGNLPGEVLIQTYQPNNYALKYALKHDFKGFYQEELENRKNVNYPPFVRLALIEFRGKNENEILNESEKFFKKLINNYKCGDILGPMPAVISKIKNLFRVHIIVKINLAKDPGGQIFRKVISSFLLDFKNYDLIVDIDPQSLM